MNDMNEQTALFAAVDALLEEAAAQDGLPHPDERKRLREAAGLSQEQIAKALSVRRETITSWETGRTAPRPPKRAAYARLLEGLAALHPVNGVNAVNAEAPALQLPTAPAPSPQAATPHMATPRDTASAGRTPRRAPTTGTASAPTPATPRP